MNKASWKRRAKQAEVYAKVLEEKIDDLLEQRQALRLEAIWQNEAKQVVVVSAPTLREIPNESDSPDKDDDFTRGAHNL